MSEKESKRVFGIIGMGTMGRNLLLNMADHHFHVSGYDKDSSKISLLEAEGGSGGTGLRGFTVLKDFIDSLQSPKAVMLLVPSGKIVDEVIAELTPLLNKGDMIIDAGNSLFKDTEARVISLAGKGLHFFGMGISGGEEGARFGPSMMPGGDLKAYTTVKPILEAIAAKVNNEPCVAYIGPGAAGHFVKMVHNGIEYALMQQIAETYELLKKGLGLGNEDIQKVFAGWNQGRLQSFLMEITATIFLFKAPGTDGLLLDLIKDEARAKGTGKWTSQSAMDLQVPLTAIDSAVAMRDLSKYKTLRKAAAAVYPSTGQQLKTDKDKFLADLENAFYFSMAIAYAQGLQLLSEGSKAYQYQLRIDEISRIWRGGCIIRAKFLSDIYKAFQENRNLEHLAISPVIQPLISAALPGARAVVAAAAQAGLAIPVYAASLMYFDALRSENMPSNLIQAQRDFFGAHTYELIGKEGVFHTEWNSAPSA